MNLALPTLAALAPPDVEITVVDEAVEPVSFDGDWDLVGITGYLTQMRRMVEIADEFRRRGRLVAIGGPYATPVARRRAAPRRHSVRGEAERTWPAFLDDFLHGRWRAEYVSHETVDVQLVAAPRVDVLQPLAYEQGVVQTSRGCPFECEFCDVIVYLGRKQRHKRPDQVVAELDQLYAPATARSCSRTTTSPPTARAPQRSWPPYATGTSPSRGPSRCSPSCRST